MTDTTALRAAAKKPIDMPQGGAWREAMDEYHCLSRPETILSILDQLEAAEADNVKLREALSKCLHIEETYGSKTVIRQIRHATIAIKDE